MWDLLMWPFRVLGWGLGVLIGLIIFGLWLYCMFDCITRRFRDPNHKWLWLAALVLSWPLGVPWLGVLAYLFVVKQRAFGH
jgi:hypothetical protein